MALKQYCVFIVLLYSWCISYTTTLLYKYKKQLFFCIYHQFGVNVFRHDDFEFINFNVIQIVPKKLLLVMPIL